MRVAVSNIAWDVERDAEVADLMRRHNVDAVEIVPKKYFANPNQISSREVNAVKSFWSRSQIEIIGMQSLMFGTSNLNMFGPPEIQASMLLHLESICRIGSRLGARRLVFGSPKSRDASGIDRQIALNTAVVFMRALGQIARKYNVIVCLEPNPTQYGANFMTDSAETDQLVRMIDCEAIRMQFDTGALTINNESAIDVLERSYDIIGHIHISEPDLVPLGSGRVDHELIGSLLKKYLPHCIASIEIRPPTPDLCLSSVLTSLQIACKYYR